MNILVIGNGFDLAHDLPTKYTDFLLFCNIVLNIIEESHVGHLIPRSDKEYEKWIEKTDKIPLVDGDSINKIGIALRSSIITDRDKEICKNMTYDFFLFNFSKDKNNPQLVKELFYLIYNNNWVEYFLQCDMHGKENWIDFESEISDVIQKLEDNLYNSLEQKNCYSPVTIINNKFFNNKFTNNVPEYKQQIIPEEQEKIRKPEISYKELRDILLWRLKIVIICGIFQYIVYNKYMEKINLKAVSPETRKIIKKQVISMLKKHMNHQEIADITGISKPAVDKIACAYKKEGTACLKEKKRGRKAGEKRQLTSAQEREIRNILIDRTPDQMKLIFMLWTRAAVCQLVQEKYGITITLRNMSEYLKRWGMTCQRPTKKAYFQDNVKLNTFMHETYPSIVKQAQKEDAVIFWGDETGINNQAYHIKGFAPKGQTPAVPSFPKAEKINMISAINNQGSCHFLCYEENMTQQRFIDFMRRLVKDTDRKVLFIVDNLKVHHGKIVAEWLSEHKDEIELFFTSPYSPEINPDEYLNHSLKQNIHSGIIPHTKKQIWRKTEKFMIGMQECQEKIASFFKHKRLKFIQEYGY